MVPLFPVQDALMLAAFRRSLNTVVVRLFFLLLVAAFVFWGVGDVIRNLGNDSAVAHVAGERIGPRAVDSAFRTQMAQVTQMFGGHVTPTMRLAVAQQVVSRLVTQAALQAEVRRLGIAAPNAALRQAVYAMPAFQGPGGTFDRARFDLLLRNNGLSEPQFLGLMRQDLAQKQLIGAVGAGAAAPAVLARAVFAFQQEKRVAAIAQLPFAAASPPANPSDAVLKRWYENHPRRFSNPAYRHITAVILSPQTLAKTIKIPDAEIAAEYARTKSSYVTIAKRSVEVISTPDAAKAKALAEQWRGGANWAAMHKAASAAGASAVSIHDATETQFPSAGLGKAVFAAAIDTVTGPIHGAFGWNVLRVTAATGGTAKTLAEVKTQISDKLALRRATGLVDQRVNNLQDALAGGTPLRKLPGNLGLAAVTGTLDAQGNTEQGTPAPIPGTPALRTALIATAFKTSPGTTPHLIDGPGHSYYALTVDKIIPAALRPYDKAALAVLENWTQMETRREQEVIAAGLLTAVKQGKSLEQAAAPFGVLVSTTPPIGRNAPPPGVPQNLLAPLFGLKQGQPAMVETPTGFVVAQLVKIEDPTPKQDPVGYGQVRTALNQAIATDLETVFADAVRARAHPRINQKLVSQIAGP